MATDPTRNSGASGPASGQSQKHPMIPGGNGRSPAGLSALDYTASSQTRFLAAVVDLVLFWILPLIVLLTTHGRKSMEEITFYIGCILAIQIILVRMFGRTSGKMLFGLYIVSNKNFIEPSQGLSPPSWRAATIRVITSFLGYGGPYIWTWALLNPSRRGVHDIASGTRVVQLHSRAKVPAPRQVLFLLLHLVPIFISLFPGVSLKDIFKVRNLFVTQQTMKIQPKALSGQFSQDEVAFLNADIRKLKSAQNSGAPNANSGVSSSNGAEARPIGADTQTRGPIQVLSGDRQRILKSAELDPLLLPGPEIAMKNVKFDYFRRNGIPIGIMIRGIEKVSVWSLLSLQDEDVLVTVDGLENFKRDIAISIPWRLQQNRRLHLCRERSRVKSCTHFQVE